MSIPLYAARSGLCKNLGKAKQKEFFDLTAKKVLPCIDNIYYSIFIKDDTNGNLYLHKLIDELCEKKLLVSVNHSEVQFFDDLLLCASGFNIYKYRLSKPELYDIFILDYLPNDETPRILIQIRAYGLWIKGYADMINESFDITFRLFREYYPEVEFSRVRENRIDYCYHTNCITNPYKAFSDANIEKSIQTEFASFGFRGHIEKNAVELEEEAAASSVRFVKDYFSLGERKSNNIFVRIYNKALEVVELAYKSFFFAIWYENGLINLYDKYCYEYAYEKKDFAYIHKAKLQFYLDYLADDNVITAKFKKAIADDLSPLKYADINDGYMPDVTTVINVEFETKRKFYYYSDDFIDNVLRTDRTRAAHQLKRLYKIIDNRSVFLDYLTSKTLCFYDNGDYADWWRRIRSVKLPDDLACKDKQLVRDYSKVLDKDIALKRAVNAVSTVALYNNNTDLNFQEDIADLLSNFNDNDIYQNSYVHNKLKKYKRLKNMLE